MTLSAREIHDYVQSLDLPTARASRGATATAPPAAPPKFGSDREVVAVGSQLTEFSDNVPAELRPLISNSMLLAQLAADKADSQSPDVFAWHAKYREVLAKIGWSITDMQEHKHKVSDKNLGVHKAIIPVLTALLGPAVAAASMVVTVLEGLQNMDTASPWITLFDRQSQHASGAKFQVSYVDANSNGDPSIKLLSCTITAEKTITQVLFFKFSAQKADMTDTTSTLSTTGTRLKTDKDVIESKVGGFISDFVKGIEI